MLQPETLPSNPLGAIPRAEVAVLLLREAIAADDPDPLLLAAERNLWLSWCSVQKVRADRDADRRRAA